MESTVLNAAGQIDQSSIYLKYIINNIPHSIFWKDQHSVFLGCNQRFAVSAGFNNPAEVIGKKDYDMPWSEFAEYYIDDDKQIMDSGIAKINYEESHTDQNGTLMTVLVSKVPMFDDQKKIIGVLGIYTDITDRKNAENQLRLAKEAAEAANKFKTNFIRNMEHDIRTPFSGIYSMAKGLAESESDPERKEYLEAVFCGAKELLDYCNKIIEFTKLEAGHLPVAQKEFNLQKLIDSIIHMEQLPATMKNLQFEVNCNKNIDKLFLGDSYRIQTILVNLISNAIKYTEKGYVKVSIFIEQDQHDSSKNIVIFTVEDSGKGMSQEVTKQINSTEFLSNAAVSKENKNSGLGFGIIKQMLKDLGGTINIKSQLKSGTLITCKIPLLLSDVTTSHLL